jgi:2-dehydropantoate 2-reductase
VVIVAGTGALGTLLAVRLGTLESVTVLGSWKAALEAFSASGAELETAAELLQARVRATSDPAAAAGASIAFVAVKAPATAAVAEALRESLRPDGVAVTLQNGLGNVEALAATLGADRVVAGAAETGATLVRPGRARSGGGNRIRLAEHPRAAGAADLLRRAGFDVEIVPDARALLWEKLTATAPLLPLTALLGVANGEILRRPSAAALLAQAAQEVAAVARAAGIALPEGEADAPARRVATATAENFSSMLQDVRRGAATEVDAINGAVDREARRHGVAAPLNHAFALAVRALGEGGRA